MTSKKKTSTTAKAKANKKALWRKKALKFVAKLSFIMVVAVASYGVYLDGKIDQKFAYDHWNIPAKVYAQSMTLRPRQSISRDQVLNELKQLNYRRVGNPNSPGEYAISTTKIDLYRRTFSYVDGDTPSQRTMLTFKGDSLHSIVNHGEKQAIAQFNIEPKLLKRLNNGSTEDRIFVPREQFPELLIETLIHTEDRQFYSHNGIAPVSILRALVANIKAGRTVQGGSTLTQQLVKNVFLTSERSLWRKVKEAYYSVLIELKYSKDQLLEIYLNEVFLGQNGALSINGFGLASEFYFARPINELTPAQTALLVAMIKGPSYYSPKRQPKRALKRRDFLLRQMLKQNFISVGEYQTAAKSSLGLKNGIGSNGKYHGFMSLVKQELSQRFSQDLSQASGLSIYTTLDTSTQRFAQQSLTKRVKQLEKSAKTSHLQGAVVVTDYRTGQVKALVDGTNANYAGFNRALNAIRPIGSLVKPFVYASALENAGQFNLATMLEDKPLTLTDGHGQTWRPLNYDKKYRQQVSLMDALSHSYNVPTVNLGMAVGLDNVTFTLNRAGWKDEIKQLPSMLLGAIEASPWQISQLYQSLANGGETKQLHTVIAVITESGESFYGYNPDPVQAISPSAAFLTKFAMHQVTQSGTARSLRWQHPNKRLAGKTGTTDDLRDSWYAGFDHNEATIVWLGRDDNKSTGLTGSSGALTVYSEMIKRHGAQSISLAPPGNIVSGYFSSVTGRPSDKYCNDVVQLPALESTWQNTESCYAAPVKAAKSVFDDFLSFFSN
ncbi:MAG: penicillin-binding protein 1B [Gammaproteobacteria bacterium]|nr:penicillin-binding protein 1B [Gammaproteobacteria bacterium]